MKGKKREEEKKMLLEYTVVQNFLKDVHLYIEKHSLIEKCMFKCSKVI